MFKYEPQPAPQGEVDQMLRVMDVRRPARVLFDVLGHIGLLTLSVQARIDARGACSA